MTLTLLQRTPHTYCISTHPISIPPMGRDFDLVCSNSETGGQDWGEDG